MRIIPYIQDIAVTGETAAKSVGTVVHRLHSIVNHLAGHFVSFFGNNSCDCTSGRDSDLAFDFHIDSHPFSKDKSKGAHFEVELNLH